MSGEKNKTPSLLPDDHEPKSPEEFDSEILEITATGGEEGENPEPVKVAGSDEAVGDAAKEAREALRALAKQLTLAGREKVGALVEGILGDLDKSLLDSDDETQEMDHLKTKD